MDEETFREVTVTEVRALVEFPATGAEVFLAVVRVMIEDVSRADASAVILAENSRPDVVVPADGCTVEVDVDYPVPADHARLNVRAHGSVTGSEAYASGDFLTTQAVEPRPEVAVPVQQI